MAFNIKAQPERSIYNSAAMLGMAVACEGDRMFAAFNDGIAITFKELSVEDFSVVNEVKTEYAPTGDMAIKAMTIFNNKLYVVGGNGRIHVVNPDTFVVEETLTCNLGGSLGALDQYKGYWYARQNESMMVFDSLERLLAGNGQIYSGGGAPSTYYPGVFVDGDAIFGTSASNFNGFYNMTYDATTVGVASYPEGQGNWNAIDGTVVGDTFVLISSSGFLIQYNGAVPRESVAWFQGLSESTRTAWARQGRTIVAALRVNEEVRIITRTSDRIYAHVIDEDGNDTGAYNSGALNFADASIMNKLADFAYNYDTGEYLGITKNSSGMVYVIVLNADFSYKSIKALYGGASNADPSGLTYSKGQLLWCYSQYNNDGMIYAKSADYGVWNNAEPGTPVAKAGYNSPYAKLSSDGDYIVSYNSAAAFRLISRRTSTTIAVKPNGENFLAIEYSDGRLVGVTATEVVTLGTFFTPGFQGMRLSSILPKNLIRTQVFSAADQTEMDALTPNMGDECVRTDSGRWFVFMPNPDPELDDLIWVQRPHYTMDEVYTKAETMTTSAIGNLLVSTESGKLFLAADETARLALDANPGDEVFQQDNGGWYILYNADATQAASWLKRPDGIDSTPEAFRNDIDVYSTGEVDAAILNATQEGVFASGGGSLATYPHFVLTDGAKYDLPKTDGEGVSDKIHVSVPFHNGVLAPQIAPDAEETLTFADAQTSDGVELDINGQTVTFHKGSATWTV